VNEVKRALAEADGTALKAALDQQGWVEVAGERLGPDDLEMRASQHADIALATEGAWAVALDRDVDEALRIEGTARELVRALNDLRKQAGFSITDRIVVTLDVSRALRVGAAVEGHRDWVAGEVLAVQVRTGDVADGYDPTIDGEPVRVALSRAG
jgi:isoleucyl-tRNA synthetase